MKRLTCFLCLLATIAAMAAGPADNEVTVTSTTGDFETKGGGVHFWDNVRLSLPGQFDLTCADLVVSQNTDGAGKSKLNRITATTNVVIHLMQPATTGVPVLATKPGETTRATAFRAVFDGADNTVTLTGSAETGQPKVEGPEFTTVADLIVINRETGKFSGRGNHRTTFKADALKNSPLFAPKTGTPAAK